MSEQNPLYDTNSIQEQIPHSGKHGYEKPVEEFDNTRLEEAVEAGLISDTPSSPNHPALLTETIALKPATKSETKLGWKKPVAIVAMTAAAIGGAFGAKQAFSSSTEIASSPEPQPTTSAPEVPGEVETTPVEPAPTSNPEDEFTPAVIPEKQHDLSDDQILLIVNFSGIASEYPDAFYMLERVSSSSIYEIDAYVDINRQALEAGDSYTLDQLHSMVVLAFMDSGQIENPYL